MQWWRWLALAIVLIALVGKVDVEKGGKKRGSVWAGLDYKKWDGS